MQTAAVAVTLKAKRPMGGQI